MTLSQAGVLSGTPPAVGASSFTLLAKDAGENSASQTFTIAIISGVSYVLNAFAAMPARFGDGRALNTVVPNLVKAVAGMMPPG